MGANDHFAADETVMIINIATWYAAYAKLCSLNQANKLPKHTKFDHLIAFRDSEARPPNTNQLDRTQLIVISYSIYILYFIYLSIS